MAQKFGRVETLVRKTRRSRFGFAYRGYLLGRRVYRFVVNRLTGKQVGWVAWVQAARWSGETSFEVSGWAYERGSGSNERTPKVTLTCRNQRTKQKLVAEVVMRYDSAANGRARLVPVDYGNFAFQAEFDLAAVLDGNDGDRWQVKVQVDSGDRVVSGPFRKRAKTSSSGHLVARTLNGRQILPVWGQQGLSFELRADLAIAEDVAFVDESVQIVVRPGDFDVAGAALVCDGHHQPLEVTKLDGDRCRLQADLPVLDGDAALEPGQTDEGAGPEGDGTVAVVRDYVVELADAGGRTRLVASGLDEHDLLPPGVRYAFSGEESRLTVRDTSAMLLVEDVQLVEEPFSLRLAGRVRGNLAGASLVLTGPRQDLAVTLDLAGERFEAVAPLLISAWGGEALPPQTGSYILRGRTAEGAWFRVSATSGLIQATPKRETGKWLKVRVGVTGGRRLSFLLSAPLAADLVGDYQQARLKAEYHQRTFAPQEAVYFESFNGRAATCNTYALDREVARRFPELKRYWGVLDLSVAVPPGAIPVLKGTHEWWEARSTCRYVIINEWIRQKFKHQPFQIVLQTWHGSMFKRIGLDRPNFSKDEQYFLSLEKAKWDILLSQNEHSTRIFRSAYAWEKPIWTEGYPRNDALSTDSGEPIRELLGIRPGQKAVLYAPTWREAHEETMVDFLDLPEMARQLGDEYVILLRGHSRTLRAGGDVRVPGVIDVTSYPHVTDLFLAADAMITDYSSVMFDYSVTGRPMIFFVPDLAQYRDKERGVYFDLEELAPGPVLASQDAVVDAIRSIEPDVPRFANRYAAWRERFNAHDDGHSAERVIDRLFALPKA